MNPVLDCLVAARKRIENPKRWGKVPLDGRECVMIALDRAATDNQEYDYSNAVGVFKQAISGSRISVTRWNDAPERTHADVLAAFDRAIELAGQP